MSKIHGLWPFNLICINYAPFTPWARPAVSPGRPGGCTSPSPPSATPSPSWKPAPAPRWSTAGPGSSGSPSRDARLWPACAQVFAALEAAAEDLGEPSGRRPAAAGGHGGVRQQHPHAAHPALSWRSTRGWRSISPLPTTCWGLLLRDDLDLIIDCRVHLLPDLERLPLFRETYVVAAAPGVPARPEPGRAPGPGPLPRPVPGQGGRLVAPVPAGPARGGAAPVRPGHPSEPPCGP